MIINAAGDALFTFLPLFLGYTAAKKFGLKPMLGLAIGAAMCYPGIQSSALSAGMEPLYHLLEGKLFLYGCAGSRRISGLRPKIYGKRRHYSGDGTTG